MTELLSTITELPLNDIRLTKSRLRGVTEEAVQALVEVIGRYGFTTPITVRRTRSGDVLMDGAHRIEAMRRLGYDTIPCRLYRCTDDEALALEIAQNLASAPMTALDDAVFLAAWKGVYEREHPETKRGPAGALVRWGEQGTEMSFASLIAERRNLSARQVRRFMAAAVALDADDVSRLRQVTDRKITQNDIMALAKADAATRRRAISDFVEGTAVKLVDALKPARAPTEPARPEEGYRQLAEAWSRAGAGARRRFVAAFADDIQQLWDEATSDEGDAE